MADYYTNEKVLSIHGYEIYFTRFADSILLDHFQESIPELERVLSDFYIHEEMIPKGGGGKSAITQSLSKLFDGAGWRKEIIESQHHLKRKKLKGATPKVFSSGSHEVDHYKSFPRGDIGLEIEWNNKDPFYDRDLENFRKLHQLGGISVGIIVTRGVSLQEELFHVFYRYLKALHPFTVSELTQKLKLSDNAKEDVQEILNADKEGGLDKIAKLVYNSKYGQATTHMNKLLLRIDRGLGNPCPLILIGIGKERLKNENLQKGQKVANPILDLGF